jgi:MoaA/NifB/PqqE/SkfB family radical SAM enzyme
VSFSRTLLRTPHVAAALWRLGRGRIAAASVNLLNECNQRCPMCAVWSGPDAQLSLADLERAFAALRAGGVRLVELAGGEPLLRKDLPEVLCIAANAGLLCTLNTNATAVTDRAVDALRRSRNLLQVAVSIDSLDRERYAFLRGRDQLRQALAGLERLRACGLPAPLKVNVAVSRHNFAEVPALLAFARARGLFLSAFPVNQGPGAHRSDCGLFAATPEERAGMAALFEELARLRRSGEPLWEPSAFYVTAARFARGEPLGACGAGELYLDLRSDGAVAPCVDLPAVGSLDDLVSGRAWAALAASRGAAAACRANTPCCYTCTIALAETGRRPVAFAVEAGRVLLKAALRGAHPDVPPEGR